jgi:GntR family transcriptional regulator/MocR family aminotransferase
MLPFQNLIHIERQGQVPVFLQLVNQVIQLIQNGQLAAGVKLPSTRAFAKLLALNRNTVTKSLEELQALGWIEIKAKKGAFVVDTFPIVQPNTWTDSSQQKEAATPFTFYSYPYLEKPQANLPIMGFDDGLPDVRLAPIDALARGYAKNIRQLAFENQLTYDDALGNLTLRKKLAASINETRGLNIDASNVIITRGTVMAIHLAVASTVRSGDKVIVGNTNYKTANRIIHHFGGHLMKVPVDAKGICVETIERICEKEAIRAVYVTSHHHHPTTVTLSPERRLQLIKLAEKNNFIILEDDYDYDFHYDNNPILPLASADRSGRVLYFGSFTKQIAPAFRVGYLIGPAHLIGVLSRLRRIFDRQGDTVLEKTIADLMEDGTIRRHLKKSWRHYKERRDLFCQLLESELGNYITFQKPAGGLAVWALFDEKIPVAILSKKMLKKGFYFPDASSYNPEGATINGVRLGFASINLKEIEKGIDYLSGIIKRGV